MADETVEIKITGDSSDLAAAMADVAKRVDLLIDALSGTAQKFEEVGKDAEKGFGKAKKATDKAAESTEKYIKVTNKFTIRLGANRKSLEAVSDRMGRVDSSMQALATMSDHLSGSLAKTGKFMAENARLAGDAAAGMEQVILAATQAPKVFGLVTASVVALGAAYHFIQKPFEETIEKHKALGEAWDRLGKSIANQAKRIREYRQELNLLNGVETKAEQIFKKRMDELKAGEKQQLRDLNNIVRKMKNNAKDMKQQERANRVLREGTKNIRDRTNVERELATETFNQAKATEELNKAEEKRAQNQKFYSEEYMKMVVATSTLGDEYKVYVKEMTASERAVDSSREAHEKMSAGLIGNANLVKMLGQSFAQNQEDTYGTARAISLNTDEHKKFEKALKTLNDSYRENLGIQEDVFVASQSNEHIFGAVNRTNLQAVGTYDVLNMAMEENLKKRRAEMAAQEAAAAATRAWVKERNALLESLQNENAALDAVLTGPFRELEQAYEAQIDALDEIIDKYEKSAKSSQKSAAIVSAAEEQKALKTIEFSRQVTGLLEEENRKREKDRIDSELAMEKALQDIQNVSKGREAETFDEKLALLSEYKEEQMRTLKDLQAAAVASGAEEVDVWRAVLDEKQQINAEYEQRKAELEEERREQQRQKRAEDIQLFSETSTMLLQGASDAFMAIAENADQMTTEQRRKMFYISQAAAMGEIAISGMVAIANIWEEYAANPIAAGIMSAGMAGITAAQIATVASQEPSFDIGGVIKGGVMANSPDQVGVNVLPGESVLNRSATERLGEQGVNALNSGKGMGQEIIVVPAYRHFDRFIKDEYRKGGAFRRFFNDAREYPVGHRSY